MTSVHEIAEWRARWTPERVGDVLRILVEDPEWGARKITGCVWYDEADGFARWPEEEQRLRSLLEGLPVLDLRGFVFRDVSLGGARLTAAHCEGASFFGCVTDADFSHAHLAAMDARKAELSRVCFCEADLSQAQMKEATVRHCDLGEANLEAARLELATFRACNLRGASLLGANLKHASFFGCALNSCTLRSPERNAQVDNGTFFGRSWRYRFGRKVLWAPLTPLFRRGPRILRAFFLRRVSRRAERTRQVFDERRMGGYVAREQRDVCGEIRLCFRDNGILHKAAVYYEQTEYWRTRARWDKIQRWKGCLKSGNRIRFGLLFCRLILAERLMGYGERPGRIVRWSLGAIGLCTLLFFWLGYDVQTDAGRWISYGLADRQFSDAGARVDLARCLLFSVERFTTVGSSILRAAPGMSHAIASFESLVGVLFVALATVAWARKAIRD